MSGVSRLCLSASDVRYDPSYFAFTLMISGSTQCGHLYCATCLNNIRVRSIEAQDFTQCGLCRGDLYLPPVLCRPLQDLIESIATTDGLTIPDYCPNVWVDRP